VSAVTDCDESVGQRYTVAIDKLRTSYKSLVKKWATLPQDEMSAEEKLDTLLTADAGRGAEEQNATVARPSPLDVFRNQLQEELIPACEEIKQKYAIKGITLEMDASDFLGGGRKLLIEIAMQTHAVHLDGTVMEGGIAFNEIQSTGGVAGAMCSGPMLRTRQLTPDGFREFVCGRIALLVRSILRQQR